MRQGMRGRTVGMIAGAAVALSLAGAVFAQDAPAAATADTAAPVCAGTNLIPQLPESRRAEIAAAVAATPYHQGTLWRAVKDDMQMTLVGTYHFGDPRHQATLDRVAPDLADAAALLVEAGPDEEARLTEALTNDPTLMVDAEGPTLPERLTEDEWALLSRAMSERGSPAMITAKMRPWYVAMMLGISPCMIKAMAESGEAGGLDHLLIESAQAQDIPIRALEPWDTVFTIFGDLTDAEEEDMIRAALPAAEYADDYAVTLSDAYFAGDVWTLWEFGRFDAYDNSGLTRAEVDDQVALAQRKLMDDRNRAWIAPLTDAARDAADAGKGIVAGFGALHLPGEAGVLALLAAEGWTLERLDR